MKTYTALLLTYERPHAPLADVARDYLGIDERTAKRRAANQELPFPVMRGESQKSPWMVDLHDLATWLDAQRKEALELHQRMAG